MALIPSVLSKVATETLNVRRSVNLNFYPPSSTARSDMWTGTGNSGGLMMARALQWTSRKSSGTIRVYYLHATSTTSWVTDVTTNISNYVSASMPGITMTITPDLGGATISSLTLANYDTCLVSSDGTPGSWGPQLNAFATAGGGIVLSTFANASQNITGFTYSSFSPITTNPGNQFLGATSLGLVATHPVTIGLSSLAFSAGSSGYGGNGTTINAAAQTVAFYNTGTTLVAVQEVNL